MSHCYGLLTQLKHKWGRKCGFLKNAHFLYTRNIYHVKFAQMFVFHLERLHEQTLWIY